MLVDPHTAVGIGAARARRRHDDVPMVCVATAHPAKFPDAVEQATGVRPPLPERLDDPFDREERLDLLPPDLALVQAHVERSMPDCRRPFGGKAPVAGKPLPGGLLGGVCLGLRKSAW